MFVQRIRQIAQHSSQSRSWSRQWFSTAASNFENWSLGGMNHQGCYPYSCDHTQLHVIHKRLFSPIYVWSLKTEASPQLSWETQINKHHLLIIFWLSKQRELVLVIAITKWISLVSVKLYVETFVPKFGETQLKKSCGNTHLALCYHSISHDFCKPCSWVYFYHLQKRKNAYCFFIKEHLYN